MTRKWIDVSVPVRTGMTHWPGDPGVRIKRWRDLESGDICTVSELKMGSHTGTHMDAGRSIDRMDLDATIGPARVVRIRDPRCVRPEELAPVGIRRGDRILFKTANSSRCWKAEGFVKDFVYVSREAARFLARTGVRMVGVDYLSVGGYFRDGVETHRELLSRGVWIVEGLDLSKVRPGPYDLICLPLKILGGDGAPALAVVRPRGKKSEAI